MMSEGSRPPRVGAPASASPERVAGLATAKLPLQHAGWTAVVASTPEGVIGDGDRMPWSLSSDLRRFKRLTMGGVLLMGRRTFETIGRPLPGRRTVVLTRQTGWAAPGVETAASVAEAERLVGGGRCFVVGGGEIYSQCWDRCTECWWTKVWARLDGQVKVDLPWPEFRIVWQTHCPAGPRDQYPTDCFCLKRPPEGNRKKKSPV